VRSPDGVNLMLSTRDEWSCDYRSVLEQVPTSNVMFRCDVLEGTFEELSAHGVEFPQPPVRKPFGLWSMFNDSEGNRFALAQSEPDEA
jgi:predicted enzyme related to lactoylglutathione lyase